MAGGGMGATGVTQTEGGQNQTGYRPSADAGSYYASLAQPRTPNTTALLNSIYQQSLGRAPDYEGAAYWANAAQEGGWDAQKLAEAVNTAGANERAKTGFVSTLNPQVYGSQRVGAVATTPSYYNTNPYAVDYSNIFNPTARTVVAPQQTLTPQQQSQYLGNWANNYSQQNRAAIDTANAQRVATANAQWANYLSDKAKAEAQAVASNQEAINKAVEEKLKSMGYDQNSGDYTGQYGSYAGKAGGSVPGGLRSLKGLTKP